MFLLCISKLIIKGKKGCIKIKEKWRKTKLYISYELSVSSIQPKCEQTHSLSALGFILFDSLILLFISFQRNRWDVEDSSVTLFSSLIRSHQGMNIYWLLRKTVTVIYLRDGKIMRYMLWRYTQFTRFSFDSSATI